MNYKVPKKDREERLLILSEIMLKVGTYKPGTLLKYPELKERYNVYKNCYDSIKKDILKVEEAFKTFSPSGDIESEKSLLIANLNLIKKELWELLPEAELKDKLQIYKNIITIQEKIAYYQGIVPVNSTIKSIEVSQSNNLNSNKDLDEGLSKLEKGLSEFSHYFDLDNIQNHKG